MKIVLYDDYKVGLLKNGAGRSSSPCRLSSQAGQTLAWTLSRKLWQPTTGR